MSRRSTVRHSTVLSTIKAQNEEISSFTKQLGYIEKYINTKVTSVLSLDSNSNTKIIEFKKDFLLVQDQQSVKLANTEQHEPNPVHFDSNVLHIATSLKKILVLFSDSWKVLDENLNEKSSIPCQPYNFSCGKINQIGKTIVTGDNNGQVILWDVVNAEIRCKTEGSDSEIIQVGIFEAQKWFVSICRAGDLVVRDKRLAKIMRFNGKLRKKEMMEISGSYICFPDRILKLTQSEILIHFELFKQSVQFEVSAFAISHNSKYLAIYDNRLSIYETESTELKFKYKSKISHIKSICFSQDNFKFFICNGDKIEVLKLFEDFENKKLKDLGLVPTHLVSHGNYVYFTDSQKISHFSEEEPAEFKYEPGKMVRIVMQNDKSKTVSISRNNYRPLIPKIKVNAEESEENNESLQDLEGEEEKIYDAGEEPGFKSERTERTGRPGRVGRGGRPAIKGFSSGMHVTAKPYSNNQKAISRRCYGRRFSTLVLDNSGVKMLEEDDSEGTYLYEAPNLYILAANDEGFLVCDSTSFKVFQYFPQTEIFTSALPDIKAASISPKLEFALIQTPKTPNIPDTLKVFNFLNSSSYSISIPDLEFFHFLSDDLRFYTISSDCSINIFELNEPSAEGSISIQDRVFTGSSSTIGSAHFYLFFSSNQGIEICSVQDFCHLTTIPIPGLTRFCLSLSAKKIFYCCSNELFSMINPVQTSQFIPVILNFSTFSFDQWKWINSILTNDRSLSTTTSALADFIVMPSCISQVLLLAQGGHKQLLKSAVRSGSKYLRSEHKSLSPLTIAICRKNKEIIATLMKEIINAAKLDPNVFLRVEDDLAELNYKGSNRNLMYFYENIYSEPKETYDSVAVLRKEPFVGVLSPTPKISTADFVIPSDQNPDLIEFRVSALRFKIEDFTADSVEFLDSIIWSASPEILKTPVIQSILLYKWRQVSVLIYYQLIVFAGYLLVLTLFVSSLRNEQIAVWGLMVFNTFFLVCEIPLINYQPYNYIMDAWNVLDSSRILLLYVFGILYCFNDGNESIVEGFILTIIILLSWIRGLAFFRIFKRTRYLVRIILEVFIDVIPFILVLSYCILSFAFVGYSLDIETVDFDKANSYDLLVDQFNLQYLLNFGDINTENYSFVDWVQFFGASILNSLIMMSMIIALMGNTYERVDDLATIAEYKEMASYILEIESMLLWLDFKSKKKYFQFCYSRTKLEIGEQQAVIDEKLKKMKEKVDNFYTDISALKQEHEKSSLECRAILESSYDHSSHQISEIINSLSSSNESLKQSLSSNTSSSMTKSLINF